MSARVCCQCTLEVTLEATILKSTARALKNETGGAIKKLRGGIEVAMSEGPRPAVELSAPLHGSGECCKFSPGGPGPRPTNGGLTF